MSTRTWIILMGIGAWSALAGCQYPFELVDPGSPDGGVPTPPPGPPAPQELLCSDSCAWAEDGECDDGGEGADHAVCAYGTDCTDCGERDPAAAPTGISQPTEPREEPLCTNTCTWAGDGECDDGGRGADYAVCAYGTDCIDCGPRDSGDQPPDPPPDTDDCAEDCASGAYTTCSCRADDPCGWRGDGDCDDACAGLLPSGHFDDSADCGVDPGEQTLAVTRVMDGLDSADMDILADGLAALGFREVVRDTNVTTAELRSYLAMDITTLYHTGHGFEGGVVTSDGAVVVGDVTLAPRNVIFATCLTLTEDWSRAFGPTTETVLGYTRVSYDFVDNEVAELFARFLGEEGDHMVAWYLANASIGVVADRWAGYSREGGSIVEYSARSGSRPISRRTDAFVELGEEGNVLVAESLLGDDRTFAEAFSRVTVVSAGELSAHVEEGGFRLLRETAMSSSEAAATVEAWLAARDELPADAVLADVTPIVERVGPDALRRTVGHVVRYVRVVDGLEVRSNLVGDHIAVLVGAGGVVAASSRWSELSEGSEDDLSGRLLGVGRATRLAAEAISEALKGGDARFVDAEPVYGVRRDARGGEDLVPAYRLRGADGLSVVISAETGELLL